MKAQQRTLDFSEIEAEVKAFEESERKRLGLDEAKQWQESEVKQFTKHQRVKTTVLFGGLTMMQDKLIEGALAGLGYQTEALECPNKDSLQLGKEFGNRGQCNPTYFTVGNLIKHLNYLRDEKGMSPKEIVDGYVFITAGGCGPCRFGMYVTEYRKALRDAGYEGFRVLLFQQSTNLKQTTEEAGLSLTPKFFIYLLKALIAGDVLNLLGYRMRPYEVEYGSVDKALDKSRQIVAEALRNGKKVLPALRRCRKEFDAIKLNRLQAKPKVSIIGEFWAMTTEGDGNYHLQRFLEQEGAEVDIQPMSNWLLYSIWEFIFDGKQESSLRRDQNALKKESKHKRFEWRASVNQFILHLLQRTLIFSFNRFAKAIGLNDYHLTDQKQLAKDSHEFYYNEIRGGEGHMEVGKLIQTFKKQKAHLLISVKPFGCMPSSSVSDGIQSLVTARYPEANFIAIETSGDGAVNVHSRVQMALFKVRQKAINEFDQAMEDSDLTLESTQQKISKKKNRATRYPAHRKACTAANAVLDL